MKRLQFLIVILVLSVVGIVQAQDTPQPVLDAFADFNEINGTTHTPSTLAWEWRETIFGNSALECAMGHINDGPVTGFIVAIIDLAGDRWEYRMTYDPDRFILCESPLRESEPESPGISPVDTAPQRDPRCDDIPIRLRAGAPGRVIPFGIPNNVREIPGTSGTYVGEIPNGGVFTVLDGPQCTDAGAWFQVDYNGMIGWTIESFYNEFFLEPLHPGLAEITPENINQVQTLATIASQEASTVDVVVSGYSIFVAGDELRRYSYDFDAVNDVGIHERYTDLGRIETMAEVYGGLMLVNREGEVYRMRNYSEADFQRTITDNDLKRHALSRNADYVVSVVDSNVEDQSELWMYDLNLEPESEPVSLISAGRGFLYMAFSYDSQYFAAISGNVVYLWDTETWSLIAESTIGDTFITTGIAFAPDDNRLFVSYISQSNPAGDIAIFNSNGDLLATRSESHPNVFGQFSSLQFGSDGDSLFAKMTVINDAGDVNGVSFTMWNYGANYTSVPATWSNDIVNPVIPYDTVLSSDGTLMVTFGSDDMIRVSGVRDQ